MKNPGEDTKELLLWYFDRYLPTVCRKYWDPEIRCYNLYTDTKCNIQGKDGQVFQNKVWVTVATEAFGLTLLMNCRDKWPHVYDYEAGGLEIPKSGPVYKEKFKAKWSNPDEGQKEYGGWEPAGLIHYQQTKKEISEIRTANSESKALPTFIYNLIRQHHGVNGESPGSKTSKKRKRVSEDSAASAASAEPLVTVEDE